MVLFLFQKGKIPCHLLPEPESIILSLSTATDQWIPQRWLAASKTTLYLCPLCKLSLESDSPYALGYLRQIILNDGNNPTYNTILDWSCISYLMRILEGSVLRLWQICLLKLLPNLLSFHSHCSYCSPPLLEQLCCVVYSMSTVSIGGVAAHPHSFLIPRMSLSLDYGVYTGGHISLKKLV